MPTTSEVGENIWVIRTSSRNAVRPGNANRAVKNAAGTATSTTIAVELVATSREVFSQAMKRSSPSTVPNVDHCQSRGRKDGGEASTSPLGRSASSSITEYG